MNMSSLIVRATALRAMVVSMLILMVAGCSGAQGNGPKVETFVEAPAALAEETPEETKALAVEDERQKAEVAKLASVSLENAAAKVEIDMYMMSLCPYGVQAVEKMMDVVEMFNGEVALNLDYIGREKPDGELGSLHGDKEVQGDIDQICGRLASPTEAQFWTFLKCVNDTWREIPEHDENCAKEAALDMTQFNKCKDGDLGKKLLASSFEKAEAAKATGSPTIIIGGVQYSGNRSAQAISQHICAQWGDERSLQTCVDLPAPPEVRLFALTDKRCGETCNPDRMIESLKSIFTGLKPEVLDWSEPRAKQMMKDADVDRLPAILLDNSVKNDESAYRHMERWLTEAGPYYKVKVKADFDPRAEICDNNKDDTKNGKVDCKDPTCKGTLLCRKENKKQLEVFVMSQCPFGAMALLAMGEVKEAFKKKDMRFQIHFIADEEDDRISSMHGESEVNENMRWLCAKKHFPRDYLDYVWCRAEDYRNPDWQQCARGKIKAANIESCMKSGEGKALLKKDIQIANKLNIGASPTWIANGRHKFSGVTPRAIQENFCAHNPDLSGCTKELSNERMTTGPAGSCGN